MKKGNINVSVENIFPLIKKFLYSDHEIFLRELISNATDATLKLKHISSTGKEKIKLNDPKIEVKIDKKGKKLHIIDEGIGMSGEEIEKYINEVAFSGAEEFLEKYKDSAKDTGIIGHFGLGFYSAFMVSSKVEIISKSYKNKPAAHWVCDGSPNYTLDKSDKKTIGTEIILHIDKDSKEFLQNIIVSDTSYYAIADAFRILSIVDSSSAKKYVEGLLNTESHNDIIRKSALFYFGQVRSRYNYNRLKELVNLSQTPVLHNSVCSPPLLRSCY